MAQLFANDTIGPSSEYQEQLRKEHSGSKWGSTGGKYSGADVLRLLERRSYIQTVLDFGAGKASLERYIRERLSRDIEWTNYDPGIPEIENLPSGTFDLVISTDVLEHVEPRLMTDTLKSLASKVGKVLYSDIACYTTGKLFAEGPYKGKDLHLTVESPEYWRNAFHQLQLGLHLAEYNHKQTYSKGRYKDRCMMIHERV